METPRRHKTFNLETKIRFDAQCMLVLLHAMSVAHPDKRNHLTSIKMKTRPACVCCVCVVNTQPSDAHFSAILRKTHTQACCDEKHASIACTCHTTKKQKGNQTPQIAPNYFVYLTYINRVASQSKDERVQHAVHRPSRHRFDEPQKMRYARVRAPLRLLTLRI